MVRPRTIATVVLGCLAVLAIGIDLASRLRSADARWSKFDANAESGEWRQVSVAATGGEIVFRTNSHWFTGTFLELAKEEPVPKGFELKTSTDLNEFAPMFPEGVRYPSHYGWTWHSDSDDTDENRTALGYDASQFEPGRHVYKEHVLSMPLWWLWACLCVYPLIQLARAAWRRKMRGRRGFDVQLIDAK